MAGQASVQGLGDDCHARRYAEYSQLVAAFLYQDFGTTRLGGRHEDAVGRAGNILLAAEDPDVGFDFVVIGSEILVSDGPVITHAISGARFKIHRGKTQSNASPVIGAAPNNA